MTRPDFDAALERLLGYLFDAEERGGYAGTYVHESERRVDLYWKGALPPSLTALLDDVRDACPTTVLPAAHDIVELRRARDRIAATPGCWDSGIVTMGLADDGSGLVLGYDSAEPPEFVARLALDVPVKWERGSAPIGRPFRDPGRPGLPNT